MMNPFKEVNWNPGVAEKRSFARSWIIGFPCLALLGLLMGRFRAGVWNFKAALLVAGVGAAAGVVLFCLPKLARPFYLAWYFLACCIGLVVGNILLAAVFFVFVTGVGLAKRAFGRQSICKTVDRGAASYWHDAEPSADPQRYYSQF